MCQRCFDDGQIHQAIGVALETKRLDKLEEAIHTSTDVAEALNYATKVCQTLVTSREFRREVLTVLVRMYESDHVENNYLNVCQCLMFLDDADGVAAILTRLVEGEEDDQLLAYQIAFSLCENEIQKFLSEVASKLAPEDTPGDTPKVEDGDADMQDGTEEKKDDTEDKKGSTEEKKKPIALLRSVLSGELPVNLHLEFLYSHNAADLLLLKQMRAAVESRNSVCHSATVLSNALMHAGTTVDTFLRENLDWLSRATNWARFSGGAAAPCSCAAAGASARAAAQQQATSASVRMAARSATAACQGRRNTYSRFTRPQKKWCASMSDNARSAFALQRWLCQLSVLRWHTTRPHQALPRVRCGRRLAASPTSRTAELKHHALRVRRGTSADKPRAPEF